MTPEQLAQRAIHRGEYSERGTGRHRRRGRNRGVQCLSTERVRCMVEAHGITPSFPLSSMNVFANTVVTLSFQLYDASNKLIEETDEPIAYLHGGHSGIFPKVEAALAHKQVGDSVSVTLEPDDAFGDYDAGLMRIESVEQLPPDIEVGGHLVAEQDGNEMVWRITDIAEGKAVLDGNHELAGQRLRFDCKVLDIRPATQEEITHGHVHGAHGHHH
jgi:FKBP-type peptidyl-prolyl cis-trans isomerase SlyD